MSNSEQPGYVGTLPRYLVITPPRCSMSNSKELKKIGAAWKALGEEVQG